MQSGYALLVCYGKGLFKKGQCWIRQFAEAGHSPAPSPSCGRGRSAGAHLLCDPQTVPGMAAAEVQRLHTKSLGDQGLYPRGILLLLDCFPVTASYACWHRQAVLPWCAFPLASSWKKETLSNWDFRTEICDAIIFLKRYSELIFLNFPWFSLYFEILRLLNAANASLASDMEAWTYYLNQAD